jgi:type IV secretory pathway TrbL component
MNVNQCSTLFEATVLLIFIYILCNWKNNNSIQYQIIFTVQINITGCNTPKKKNQAKVMCVCILAEAK